MVEWPRRRSGDGHGRVGGAGPPRRGRSGSAAAAAQRGANEFPSTVGQQAFPSLPVGAAALQLKCSPWNNRLRLGFFHFQKCVGFNFSYFFIFTFFYFAFYFNDFIIFNFNSMLLML